MRELTIPQSYEAESHLEDLELQVIAVMPAGSAAAARRQLTRDEPELAGGLALLQQAHRALVGVLHQLIDELDGLAYRRSQHDLLPLAGEPFWRNLSTLWPDPAGNDTPDLDAIAEWLVWFAEDADHWWGGLAVVTDRGFWLFGDRRPVRDVLDEATSCHISRRSGAATATVIELILARLPAIQAEQLRQAVAGVHAVNALSEPMVAQETERLLRQLRVAQLAEDAAMPGLAPPPASHQPKLAIAIDYRLHPDTPADPNELSQEIAGYNAAVQALTLLEPSGDAERMLDACLPPSSEARRLLDRLAATAPELHVLARRVADHLDGLAHASHGGPVPMAAIVLHLALSEALRYAHGDPWYRAALFYGGLRQVAGYHLMPLRLTTAAGSWSISRSEPLRVLLAGQRRCTIALAEDGNESDHDGGPACLDWPISDRLLACWQRLP